MYEDAEMNGDRWIIVLTLDFEDFDLYRSFFVPLVWRIFQWIY